ncbi:MAG: glycosyltransferase [Clostridia bacterium]|nr:glycosyltransferase [Clostridia bacterium]
MKNKAILICLEKFGVGGVETSVVNQSLAFREKGYDVVILAQEGIYTKKVQDKGITFINCEFDLGNEIDKEKTSKIIEIIQKYNIGQVHIHQYPCLLSALPACLITNTPYVAFVHSRLTDIYDWYKNCFSLYKRLLKVFFDNAYKIVTLNYSSIDLNAKYFNIDKEKYRVLKNSIYLDEYAANTEVTDVKNFIIISRIAEEKLISIQNGINFFIEYANSCENFDGKLAIYGDGSEETINKVKKYIAEHNTNNYNISLAGSTNEVAKEMEKYDAVIGMGRCIIEALATKRLSIITSPNELKFLIDNSNIYSAIEANFASNDLKAQSIKDMVAQLKKLNSKKIKKITDENYKVVSKELNMIKNVYCIENSNTNVNYSKEVLEILDIQLEDIINKKDAIIEEKYHIIEDQEKKITELTNELNSIYNSKRFQRANKIADMFNKFKK